MKTVERSVSGWQTLRVTAKVRETDNVTSFWLTPQWPDTWQPFQPGQFLVFRLPGAQPGATLLRHYSLSSSPDDVGTYRISVKLEPGGQGSSHLHDHVNVGDCLQAQGPRGNFVLNQASGRPVVLLSGGVGLTPMVSMLYTLVRHSDRTVYFVHACENASLHALRAEVDALALQRPGITVHYVYRSGCADDVASGRCHGTGLLNKQALQAILPLDDYEVYLCGPPPFMQALYGTLCGLGIAQDRLAYEFFGPASLLHHESARLPTPADLLASQEANNLASVQVEFRRSGKAIVWTQGTESLLSLAESIGLQPTFSCRAGVCGSCRVGLLEGQVRYTEEPLDPVPAGEVLLCCAQPAGSVVLAL